jgi:hypothetical protein
MGATLNKIYADYTILIFGIPFPLFFVDLSDPDLQVPGHQIRTPEGVTEEWAFHWCQRVTHSATSAYGELRWPLTLIPGGFETVHKWRFGQEGADTISSPRRLSYSDWRITHKGLRLLHRPELITPLAGRPTIEEQISADEFRDMIGRALLACKAAGQPQETITIENITEAFAHLDPPPRTYPKDKQAFHRWRHRLNQPGWKELRGQILDKLARGF